MAFLFQDQNQGTRNNGAHAKSREAPQPFSFIRTLTVGLGIAPNLLTLLPEESKIQGNQALAGLGCFTLTAGGDFHPALRTSAARHGQPFGTMPGRPGPGKRLWHGESACPHAAKSGSGGDGAGVQKLTKCKHAIPIPVCSQINNCDGDQLWKYRAQGCDGLGVQLRGFRKSHQLIPAAPDQPGRHRGMAVGGDASAIARTGPRVRINRSRK
jgi:hypothetical protein